MHSVLEFLLKHGYAVLFAWVLAEQIGLPVPSLPILLAAGALAGSGRFNFAASSRNKRRILPGCMAASIFPCCYAASGNKN